jgi:type II secretory pathway pseudopilin PulG
MLLSVMLLVTLMLIALSVELPRISQQIKRQKEEELVHRGMEYAKAIKKYRRKMGALPTSLEQLENTNHIRFLRKRYKDPITGGDEWKLVHAGEALIPLPKNNNPGLQGSGNPGIQGGTFTNGAPSGFNSGAPSGFNSGAPSAAPSGTAGLNNSGSGLSGGTGLSGGSGISSGGSLFNGGSGLSGSSSSGMQPGGGSQVGTLATDNIAGPGALQVGGGGIIGVASTSKKSGIKEFNDDSEYDQWYFVYDPRLEQATGQNASATAGIIVAAPQVGAGGAGGAQPSPTPVPQQQ